jgi:hypothetical protein
MGKNQWWVGNLDRLRNGPLLCNVGRGGGAGRSPPFEDERGSRPTGACSGDSHPI